MTNESKFETLAISSLPLGKGYRVTINLEHHVDVPLQYVNAHVRDFLSACAAFATKMRDAIDPPPKEESQAPDNAAKVHNNVEPVAWGVANGSRVLATSISRMDAVDMQSEYACDTEIVPLYRSPTLADAEVTFLRRERDLLDADDAGDRKTLEIIAGLLARLGGGR